MSWRKTTGGEFNATAKACAEKEAAIKISATRERYPALH